MKLYKVTQPATDNGAVVWTGTQATAKAAGRLMQAGVHKAVVEEVEFPTDKPRLLAYLNSHFNCDNG
jgi:hypothetical protein